MRANPLCVKGLVMAYLPRFMAALAACVCLLPAALTAQQGQSPAPVTVVTVEPQDVTLTSLLPGRVAASAEAEVRPQVNGIITERLFEEGADVSESDPLYQIDRATYEATVRQARASVAQAEAQLRAAEIELSRTTIRARLSGRIGLSQTSQGALVTASQAQPLAVIRNINPVYVDVTQSAADLLRWRRGETEEELRGADATVRLILADGSDYSETGQLKAAEPNVDPQTGVVTLRMQFDNPDLLLLPGMYVQVDMPVEVAESVYLVPQEGVVRDRRGRPNAWVVNEDNVIEERTISIVQDLGNQWVVDEGLNPGDRIVVSGFQKTSPGATVAPEERSE